MKILITGGAGFIGSNFIRMMLIKYPDYEFINLDKLTYAGNIENMSDIGCKSNYRFIKGDICDFELMANITRSVDVVFHFAAESHVDNSIKDPAIFTRTNVLGTHALLEASRINSVKRFIHISTDEVYGSIKEGSFREEDMLRPNSPYSASKAAADMIARAYHMTYGFPVIITRSSNNYGPYQHPEKLMPLFITNLIEDKKVPLYGKGENIRDWIYVRDNCEGIEYVWRRGECGELYNIGGHNEMSNIDITNILLKETGKDKCYIENVEDRLGHDFRYSLDCSKIMKLGWKPRYCFDDAIKETVKWYSENQAWWKKIKGAYL